MEQVGENENFSSAELATLILTLLRDDENLYKTMHALEQESAIFLNMEYLKDRVQAGDWEEVEKYLSGFIKFDDSSPTKALLYKIWNLRHLQTKHQQLAEANNMLLDLKKRIEEVPILADKLAFPNVDYPRLKILVNRCLDRKMTEAGNALKAGTSGGVAKYSSGTAAHDSEKTRNDKPNEIPSKNLLPMEIVSHIMPSSNVTSMDFHPLIASYLLVGTERGDIALYSILDGQIKAHQIFKIWSSSEELLALKRDSSISVKNCIWNHDGSMVCVAFSKRLLELYYFRSREGLSHHLEIDAHLGIIHDISFLPGDKRAIATCGDDKAIRIWSLVDGHQQFIWNNESPILSVCPKEEKKLIWFADEEGNIKRWLYANSDPVFEWNALTLLHAVKSTVNSNERFNDIKLTLSEDRLFSCGTEFEGDSHLAEWDVTTKTLLRVYSDLKNSTSPEKCVHFDVVNNKFLVAGDFKLKFWAVNHSKISFTFACETNLDFPLLKLNRRSYFLAVCSRSRLIRILANNYGKNLMKDSQAMQIGGIIESEKLQKISKIEFKALQLPDPSATDKVVRLVFASDGSFIVALLSNGTHKVWRWNKNYGNPSGVATAHVVPLIWSPEPGAVMLNETIGATLEQAACCVVTKNDRYLGSASGGRISIFDLESFKVLRTLPGPPPIATCLALDPNNSNIVAIGMEDSSIKIYNIQLQMILATLKGHQNKISGLAFSRSENILVSAGADAQLCSWSMKGWMKEKSRFIQPGHASTSNEETYIEFNKDETRLLVVLERVILIYDGKIDSLHTVWVPEDILPAPISSATFSCDGLMVYASFCDGGIAIFDSEALILDTWIVSKSYLPSVRSSERILCPTVIAAHPMEPDQIAIGMNNGAVYILQCRKMKRSSHPPNKSLQSAPRFSDWLRRQNKPP